LKTSADAQRPSIREAFDDFVGQTFYGQLIGSMRKTVGKPAYFHGGRAEEIFQSQMDQQLAEHMSDATADSFSGPMFELFSLKRT
jgi:Rod binding domain-containing protein